jgi:3-hydroxyisobutyrate dehydrogenase-like beta-hydroxyacid dehydrogenase
VNTDHPATAVHPTRPVLGFLGLGKMGAPMAMRFVEAGYPMCVFDPDAAAMAPFLSRGAGQGASPADVASRADLVFLCLPRPDVMRRVVLGDDGIVHGSRAQIVVDLGTTGPATERAVAEGLAREGRTLVDSPVTGGLAGAKAGTLAVMVACGRDTFDRLEPVLSHLGRVIRAGEAPGLAQVAKLANNLLSAAALAVSSEAMALGVKAGLDPRVLLDVINAGSGRNSATEDKFPRAILTGTFDFGMSAELFLKDVRLALEEAESLGVPAIAGSAVKQLFAVTCARFGGAADFTSVARVIEEWAGVAIRDRRG